MKRIICAPNGGTLTFVAEHLNKPTIVALTTTPPYDVSPFEWQRYEELCGVVDAEVSVPELVLSGDLCPHQDYFYFSVPSEREQRVLSEFRAAVDSFIQRLRLIKSSQQRYRLIRGSGRRITTSRKSWIIRNIFPA